MPNFKVGDNNIHFKCQANDSVNVKLSIYYDEKNDNSPPNNDINPIYPSNNDVVDDANLVIKWTNASDPDGDNIIDYEFELSDDSTFTIPYSPNFMGYTSAFNNGRINEYPVRYIAWLNHNDTYYWRVRAKDANGYWGNWSNTFSFKVLNIKWPINLNYSETDDSIKIYWSPHPEGKRPQYFEIHHSNEKLGFIPDENTLLTTSADTFIVLPKKNLKAYYRIISVSSNSQKSYPSEPLRIKYPIFQNVKIQNTGLYKINLNVPRVYQRLYYPVLYSDGNILYEKINYEFINLPYFAFYNSSDTSLYLQIDSLTRGKLLYDSSLAMLKIWSESYNPYPYLKNMAKFNNDYFEHYHNIKIITDYQNSIPQLSNYNFVLYDTLNLFNFSLIDKDLPYGDSIVILKIEKPEWLSFAQSGYNFFATANLSCNFLDYQDSIVFFVKDKISDTIRITAKLNVKHLNRHPILISFPNLNIYEDDYFEWNLKYFDLDEKYGIDTVRIEIIEKPNWLNFDSSFNKFSGTPIIYDLTDTVLILKLKDNFGGDTTYTFNFKIIHVNHAPKIVVIPKTKAYEDSLYYFKFIAVDIDSLLGDSLIYMAEKKPDWLTLNQNSGELYGIPKGKDVGQHLIKIKVADSEGAYDSITYVLEVIHVNHAPYFEFISYADSLIVDGEYELRYEVKDIDSELFGDIVEVEFEKLPRYALAKPEEKKVELKPRTIDYANRDSEIIIKAKDNHGLYEVDTVRLNLIWRNHPPIILSKPNIIHCYEDELFEFEILIEDEDEIVGDEIETEAIIQKNWLSYLSDRNVLRGIPRITDLGLNEIKIISRDKFGAIDSVKFYVNVEHVNHAPKIIGLSDYYAKQDSLFSAKIFYEDIDELHNLDELKFYLIDSPSWIFLDTLTRTLSGVPDFNYIGKNYVKIKVQDSYKEYDEKIFEINVAKKIRIVKFEYPKDLIYVDSLYEFKISFQDSIFYSYINHNNNKQNNDFFKGKLNRVLRDFKQKDLDSFKVQIIYKPDWLNYDQNSLMFYGMPTYDKFEFDSLKFALDFLDGNIFEIFILFEIAYKNSTPKLTEKKDLILLQDKIAFYQLKGVDNDAVFGDKVLYKLKDENLYNWISLDYYSGLMKLYPSEKDVGKHIVKVLLLDMNGSFAEDSISIVVMKRYWVANSNIPDTIKIDELEEFSFIVSIRDTIFYANEKRLYNYDELNAERLEYVELEIEKIKHTFNDVYNNFESVFKKSFYFENLPTFLNFNEEEKKLYGKPTKKDCAFYKSYLNYKNSTGDEYKKEFYIFVKRVNYKPAPTKLIVDNVKEFYDEKNCSKESITLRWNPSRDENIYDTLTYIIRIYNQENIFEFQTNDTCLILPVSILQKNSEVKAKLYVSDNYDLVYCDSLFFNINFKKQEITKDYYIMQNYPNPFNGETTIKFGIPEPSRVKIFLYDIMGKKLYTLYDDIFEQGNYVRTINFENIKNLSSGVYYIQFQAYSLRRSFNKVIKAVYAK